MTIPKTHPLYGAVEALMRRHYEMISNLWAPNGLPPFEKMSEREYAKIFADVSDDIRALESAGYRVVGPEPTKDMINAAEEMYMPMGEMIAAWDGFWHAAPTITETEKGAG